MINSTKTANSVLYISFQTSPVLSNAQYCLSGKSLPGKMQKGANLLHVFGVFILIITTMLTCNPFRMIAVFTPMSEY